MKRRNFLQLVGIGGLTSAMPIPLFGNEGASSKLWTPEQRQTLAGGHLVLVRGPTIGQRLTRTDNPYVVYHASLWPTLQGVVLLDSRDQFRGSGMRVREQRDERRPFPLRVMDDDGVPFEEFKPVTIEWTPGEDVNLVFYQEALRLRDVIRQNAIKLLQSVHESHQLGAQIVTVVVDPLYLYDGESDHPKFSLGIGSSYTQYIVRGELDLNGWEVYSEFGEYPIDFTSQSQVNLDALSVIDTRVITGDLQLPKRLKS